MAWEEEVADEEEEDEKCAGFQVRMYGAGGEMEEDVVRKEEVVEEVCALVCADAAGRVFPGI